MKIKLLLFVFAIVIISCNKTDVEVADGLKTIAIDDLFADNFEAPTEQVSLEGLCVHICRHSGKKMFLVGDNEDNRIQIFVDGDLTVFPKELEGSKLRVIGLLNEEKIEIKDINAWQEELIASEDEVETKDEAHACEFEENMHKLEQMKLKAMNNPKGYLPRYTLKCTKFEEI